MGLNEVPDTLEDFPWLFPGNKVVCVSENARQLGLVPGSIYTVSSRSGGGIVFLDELPDDTVGFVNINIFEKIRS